MLFSQVSSWFSRLNATNHSSPRSPTATKVPLEYSRQSPSRSENVSLNLPSRLRLQLARSRHRRRRVGAAPRAYAKPYPVTTARLRRT
ncbi:hypothetical protein AVEN_180446-1 [Araneus ventricosus]|uniref:Uncharacterized protein n=1 Tax=Araneus ventricosus TaxID=182803 RepID=A0A4Y2GM56_ARAVE|nr:hypothetical protein AVEN_180446-1 [Araneus ventricosus]